MFNNKLLFKLDGSKGGWLFSGLFSGIGPCLLPE